MILENCVFRGERDYILGADILDNIQNIGEGASAISAYDFMMKTKASTLCEYGETPPSPDDVVASYQDENQKIFFWESGKDIANRIKDNEPEVFEHLTVDVENKSVAIPAEIAGISLHRKCVAAFKHLLNAAVLDGEFKYLFVRLQMKTRPEGEFSITYRRLVARQFYEGTLLVNDEPVGSIYFTAEEVRP